MGKKIVIVGGVAGGASVAARVRRLDETAEITMFEKGPNVSFSNCALPYYLSGTVKNAADIVLMTPEKFQQRYNINARTETEVVDVDPEMQIVTYINQRTGKQAQQSYDELFLAPGATPILPQTIKGITNANVFTVRNVPDIEKLQNYLVDNSIQKVTVIGGGFIGLEIAENLIKAGRKVALIEATSHVMQPLDEDMAQILHKELVDNGVNLIVSDAVTEISKDEVTLKSGKKLATEAVVAAIGVQPEVTLAKKIGVHLGETGAIAVNHHYQTNLPHVYAVGDAIEVTNMLTRKKQRLDLAFPAQMEARHVADHIYGRTTQQRGVLGSQVIRLFNLNAASTGLTEKQCDEQGIEYSAVTVIPKDKVALMPNVHSLFLKLVFGYPTGEILGAQAIGMSEVDKQINVIATAITLHAHVEDLQDLELCYQPLFSTTKNAVNFAGLVATNILNGEYKQVPVSAVRQLVKDKAFIIDARERDEYAQGHVKGAVNIPLSEFRDRLSEVPKDQPVYVHCLTSLRSYNMVRALVNLGYTNVHNIVGSFLGISEYNYYHDLVDDRESIVDHYKFDLD
ncbi:FAD-dependent oxidoreductase [Loigolactobacillus iwatensis]|uniref:FAD-dependent oxidoreductase n=1 Tax=Loigolactobacillus iwatensis TaxID=1267156 RepID=UPI000F7DE5EA|nr:FAD-dependent oxidoreductase [Loigolactobacillus iwatensis]